jgi:hypothetical protein
MMRSAALAVFSVSVMAVAVSTGGCGGESTIELGPKPASYSGEKAHQSQLVDDMRAWLQTLTPEQTDTLKDVGSITIAYEELRESDPVRAQMIEAYRAEAEARIAERMEAAGQPVPVFAVESVSFVRHERDASGRPIHGVYEFRFDLADGSVLTNVSLSDPL